MRILVAALLTGVLAGVAMPAPAHARVTGHSERLVARARRGDRAARAAVVEEHLGLVRSVAHRYRDLGLPVEDLVQEGAIGLLAAIDDYDATRGTSFSSYAFWRVRAAITHALTARGRLVRPPRPVLERDRQVRRARSEFLARGVEPTVAELAALTTLTPVQVAEALAATTVVSLDGGEGRPVAATTADENAEDPQAHAAESERNRALHAALDRLRGPKRQIVRRHFGIGCRAEPLAAIAGDLRLSPARTRALRDAALRDLAAALGGEP